MSAATLVNCNAGFLYQARARIPIGGKLATPLVLGAVPGLVLRLSLTDKGPAIAPELDQLTAVENPAEIGLFEVPVDQDLQQQFLLPLGRGKRYYGIWSKDGTTDDQVDTFIVADRSDI
jgi:hypothetical protein